MSTDLSRSSEQVIRLLGELYQFREHAAVTSFLKDHPFLAPLLLEAHEKIREKFEPDAQLVLDVFSDPEAEDHRELFALVLTKLSPDKALARLDRLDQEWWAEASLRANSRLNIDVEYLP